MSARVLAALFALGLSGCLLGPTEEADCAGAARCSDCLSRAGCGWCSDRSACVPGSAFGPDEGRCGLSVWRFTGCDRAPNAVGSCRRREGCNSCLFVLGDGDSDCQWCPATAECLDYGETCAAGAPTFQYDLCRSSDCRAQTTCGACVGAGCRWCDVGGGQCTDSYECPRHYQISSTSGRCPPPNDCASAFGCSACLARPGCGWCDSGGGNCVAVDGSSDYADWCNSFDLFTARCP